MSAEDNHRRRLAGPAPYDENILRAVQACALYAQGAVQPWEPGQEPPAPSPLDVNRMLDWIINHAALTHDNGFVADDPGGRIGAFVEGRRFVGQQLIKMMKLRAAIFDKKP